MAGVGVHTVAMVFMVTRWRRMFVFIVTSEAGRARPPVRAVNQAREGAQPDGPETA
jgi:hypothetical protein